MPGQTRTAAAVSALSEWFHRSLVGLAKSRGETRGPRVNDGPTPGQNTDRCLVHLSTVRVHKIDQYWTSHS